MARERPFVQPGGAVLLDRDGVISKQTAFVNRPEDLALIEGAAAAISRLNRADWPVAVITNQGAIETPMVVNAAGPWLARVARLAGIDLPVVPYRRQIFVTNPFPAIPDPVPMVIDFQPSFYFRKEGPGILMGMTDDAEPPSFNTHVDWNFLEQVVDKAVHRAPVLAQAGFMDGWGGLYAVTPDDNPILGPVPEIEGFFCAGGFSGHGFMLSPAVGRVLAELILRGHAQPDISALSIHRLREGREFREERVI